ncbi:hypothetical protein E3N88_31795 [Mikania micrantha]|uniref:Uncharacterized protein n=1 Tax=Mikania micrantha TaxID=192012 RepID=A0A5N6M780_9ASTR|nr:hypothetical protein E3N88_31795 [Mikania micrantha]
MSKVATLLQKGKKAVQDLDLIKVLQSEIRHELSNDLYKNETGSLGDFVIDWDSPHSKDMILRKKCESGEEIAVSALLGEETFVEDNLYPKEANMKVCIKKNGLSSMLQFDCTVSDEGQNKIDFHIQNAYYLKSPTILGTSVYRGPIFRAEAIPNLQRNKEQPHHLSSPPHPPQGAGAVHKMAAKTGSHDGIKLTSFNQCFQDWNG